LSQHIYQSHRFRDFSEMSDLIDLSPREAEGL